MSESFHVLTIPFLLAMFVAVNMGGSGTAPAFAAAYGAKAIRQSIIPGLFGITVLAGALLAGRQVSLTLGEGLLEQEFFTPFTTSVILFSVGATLLLANLLGVPQSTSQSTVMSIAGAALAVNGLNTHTLFYEILPTWFVLPVISFVIMLALAKWILPPLRDRLLPTDTAYLQQHAGVRTLLIGSALYVAFSIGANNVANAAAPIASLTANEMGEVSLTNFLPILILSVLIVAPCFAIGSSLLGHKVTATTGRDIVAVTPLYASVIGLLVASLLLLASVTKGIPTSLVQLNGAAFIALSVSKKGYRATFTNPTVRKFFSVWAVAPAAAFLLSYLILRVAG
ncbi:inorganic phosphate transporter [Lewinella sp. IMCC34183]|uniref:inorganic phosphate transporter n=1 Tax=Lewinella sp. IMCC34183 TaxID=2248762 RepID=UPI000E21D6D7|nr:inorganic phosphate transporter [Lewinella sp. IMCC34183]